MNNRRRWIWFALFVCSGLLGGLGVAICTLLFIVGTLFFDDPNASYGKFLLTVVGYDIIPVMLVFLAIFSYKKFKMK